MLDLSDTKNNDYLSGARGQKVAGMLVGRALTRQPWKAPFTHVGGIHEYCFTEVPTGKTGATPSCFLGC